MDAQHSSYEAPTYDVPNVVRIMGNILRVPRGQYSRNFTDIVSSNREVQHAYTDGLLAVMATFFVIFGFWVFVLLALKIHGENVGCAAGRPFSSRKEDEELSTDDDDSSSVSSLGIDSRTESQENSVTKLIKKKDILNSFSTDDNVEYPSTTKGKRKEVAGQDQIVKRRERRTRFCFMFSGLVAFACVPLILVLSFGPMREAAKQSNDIAELTRDLVLQVNSSVNSIQDAMGGASDIIMAAPLSIETLCPNVEVDDFEASIGMDLTLLFNYTTVTFDYVMEKSEERTEFIRRLIQRLQEGVENFESTVDDGEQWMWIVPAVLFAVCIVTSLAMFGVILAWKGKAGRKVQNTMSYVILPLLMATALSCWIIVLVTSLGTMVGSDMCTASSAEGSPDDTIRQAIRILNLEQNSTILEFTQTYTNRCIGPVPTKAIDDLQLIVQDSIDDLWQEISKVDSIGRSQIMQTCGGTELERLLSDARTLAKLLTSIRRSLDSTSLSLSCPRINPLYISLAHDTICTEATSASAKGFIFFLVLGISLMTMVSLRAAWLQVISEEKVYHDAVDIVENMILDEHEEYLAYISRYKHEWEEYHGFDGNALESPFNDDDEEGWSSGPGSSSYISDFVEENAGIDLGPVAEKGSACESNAIAAEPSGFQVLIVQAGEGATYSIGEQSSQHYSNAPTKSFLEKVIHHCSPKDVHPPEPPIRPPPQNPDFTVLRAPVRSKSSSASQPSRTGSSFFDKYAIEPGGQSGHGQEVGPSSTRPYFDPLVQASSFFAKYGIQPGQSARAKGVGPSSPRPSFDPPARGPSLGKLPSGRKFFTANPTDYGEVEIELENSILSKSKSSERASEG